MYSPNILGTVTVCLTASELVSLVEGKDIYKLVTLFRANIAQADGTQITYTDSALPATVGDTDNRLSFTLRLSKELVRQG